MREKIRPRDGVQEPVIWLENEFQTAFKPSMLSSLGYRKYNSHEKDLFLKGIMLSTENIFLSESFIS